MLQKSNDLKARVPVLHYKFEENGGRRATLFSNTATRSAATEQHLALQLPRRTVQQPIPILAGLCSTALLVT